MSRILYHSPPCRQHGVALVVALILLVVMTLLGLSSMDSIMQETKMATNAQERAYAFRTAETALAESERLFDNFQALATVSTEADREIQISDQVTINNVDRTPERNGTSGPQRLQAGVPLDTASNPIGVMEYRGIFAPVAGAPQNAYSAIATNVAYFELMTVAQNHLGADANQSKVRAGYRQLVPQL